MYISSIHDCIKPVIVLDISLGSFWKASVLSTVHTNLNQANQQKHFRNLRRLESNLRNSSCLCLLRNVLFIYSIWCVTILTLSFAQFVFLLRWFTKTKQCALSLLWAPNLASTQWNSKNTKNTTVNVDGRRRAICRGCNKATWLHTYKASWGSSDWVVPLSLVIWLYKVKWWELHLFKHCAKKMFFETPIFYATLELVWLVCSKPEISCLII